MGRNRIKRAYLNLISTSLYEIVTFICGLILPRLILRNFGSTYNGITSSVTQFLKLISVLRLGVAGATKVALYKTIASNDLAGTSAIIRATEKYMSRIGFVILLYIVVLAVFYPRFANTGIKHLDVALLIVAAGIGTFAQYFFGLTYEIFLSADQSVYIYSIAQIGCTIANTLLSVFLIYIGCSIQEVKLGSSLVFFITPLALSRYVSRKYKLEKKCEPDFSGLKQRKYVIASSLANIVHENTDIVVLTLFCDVKVVSVYSVYNLVILALGKILTIFSTGTEAIFGDMWVKRQTDAIKRNLSIYEYVIGVFISIICSATIILIVPFVSLYTKGVNDINYNIPLYALVITISMIWFCFRTPYFTLVQGIGHYKETKNGAYFEAGLNLISSIVFVQYFGIIGTAIGTLIANIFRSLQYAYYIDKNIIHRGFIIIAKRILWISLNILCTCFSVKMIFGNYAEMGWISWCIVGCILITTGTIVTVISSLLFYRDDAKNTFHIVLRMIGKK